MMKESINYYGLNRPEVASFVPLSIRSILDIGCAQGGFLKLIKERTGAETWGVEVVPEIADIARTNADNILIGKIENILDSLPDDYFDCITFNDVLEHLLEPQMVLEMVKPKLSKNGIIIASIPNVRYFYNLRDLLIYKEWEYKESGILDTTHFRFFTKKSIERMFKSANLYLLSQQGINATHTWKFRLFNMLTLGFFNDTKYMQFVCIASIK